MLQQYSAFLQGLDIRKLNTIQEAMQQFKKICNGQPEIITDTAFLLFHNFYDTAFQEADKDTTDLSPLILYDENGHKMPVSEKLLAREAALKENGIVIEQEEGTAFLAQDMQFLVTHTAQLVSPAIQQYLGQLSQEQKEGFQNDAGLVITPVKLAERVVWWERFNKQFPHFIFRQKAVGQHQFLFNFLLIGMDNTPVEDGNDQLSADFKEAYVYLNQQHSGTDAERYVTPYLQAYTEKNAAKARQIRNDYKKRGILTL